MYVKKQKTQYIHHKYNINSISFNIFFVHVSVLHMNFWQQVLTSSLKVKDLHSIDISELTIKTIGKNEWSRNDVILTNFSSLLMHRSLADNINDIGDYNSDSNVKEHEKKNQRKNENNNEHKDVGNDSDDNYIDGEEGKQAHSILQYKEGKIDDHVTEGNVACTTSNQGGYTEK